MSKKNRTSIGYTHARQLSSASRWYEMAVSFHEAALVLHDGQDRVSAGFRIFAFNAAISLELIIKAILCADNQAIPTTHNLGELARAAHLELNPNQMQTLDLLSEVIIWLGRYPSPTAEGKWDNFHDNVLEKHMVKSKKGNFYSITADPQTFPNKKIYLEIWDFLNTTRSKKFARSNPVYTAI